MFERRLYVPVVRWKQAERLALRNLALEEKQHITPLIELTPRINRKPGSAVMTVVEEIANDWGHEEAFVDLQHLGLEFRSVAGFHPLRLLATAARSEKLALVYVTPLRPMPEFIDILRSEIREDERGVCLRIPLSDATRESCLSAIAELLNRLRVEPAEVDLVLDGGVIDRQLRLPAIVSELGDLLAWRSFAFLGGAFPKDLRGLNLGSNLLPRTEWDNWSAWRGRPDQIRLPIFGDFTIQWAQYEEPPDASNPSASIRYTTPTESLVMRGEALRAPDGTTRYGQYPANAELLCTRPEFCGEGYSYGDHYIWSIATRRNPTTGSPMSWLLAGMNHHMTLVVRQLQTELSALQGAHR